MKDDGLILRAWEEAQRSGRSGVLATVVKVNGSAYRRPGARMLVLEGGDYIGSISGGCLESDVVKKAWWLTEAQGSVIRVYDNTADDDSIWDFGLGCEGIVHVLLERWAAGSQPVIVDLLAECGRTRRPGVTGAVIAGDAAGERLTIYPDGREKNDIRDHALAAWLREQLAVDLVCRRSGVQRHGDAEVFIETVLPPRSLLVCGAGYDAVPVVRLAKELGWHVTVIDGRSHYARKDRFPEADQVGVANLNAPLEGLTVDEQTAAVVMSHSYGQDLAYLKALMPAQLPYLGVLGPRRRTERILNESGLAATPALHSPVGLDIGAETPEQIAMAILAEAQAVFARRPGGNLAERSGPIHEPLILPEVDFSSAPEESVPKASVREGCSGLWSGTSLTLLP